MKPTDPNHIHTYDAQGNMTCCSLEEKIYQKADAKNLLHEEHSADDGHDHDHVDEGKGKLKIYLPVIVSLFMLLLGIAVDNLLKLTFFTGPIRLAWYVIAYIPVAWPVMKEGWLAVSKGEFFTEFTLMVLATIGAFAIGEYPEGVAVMLFYAIGELFQSAAVNRAKSSIKALLDIRPLSADVFRDNKFQSVKPQTVEIGETIQIKAGEKVPLDGEMMSDGSSFNTAALTGESKPNTIYKGQMVLAGMLNLDKVVELKVTKKYGDSSLARILDMVQNATARKATTELLIRRLAKIYTPIVFFLAVALVIIPFFVVPDYVFRDWLYRALIFLVISCPCALVISIPLGYFGGIGAASRNGILFKGSNYLELMTKVNTIVMDKTGTLTEGVFKVQEVVTSGIDKKEFIKTLAALESKSTHPIAKAIAEYQSSEATPYQVEDIQEISGHGLIGKVNGQEVLAGNTRLLKKYNIEYDVAIDQIIETIVVVAINKKFAGYVLIADRIKEDASETIKQMHRIGIKQIVMLSGDKMAITQKVAGDLGIDTAHGDLLPEHKVEKVEALKQDKSKIIAFVGDGINDAPVLALSDVGIAMGAMGSDAAIETANVVIQTAHTSKIVTAIKIGRATKRIVIQNITLAFAVKVVVLILGAGGLATMWEAVFADVGVALLAILNAVRIQRMDFK
ncbi:MAG: cadmium-translocating P-type ATPase [Saprospiraceae bacterium]|nr:cadmium-translocating P-type ATPase [Saprospiraceae bacterium]MBP8085718.1 cadmium-translocating P-type ATPase [Saprospiraceae bacterium]